MIFLVFIFSKNKAFPAYSPKPFGVKIPAVKAPSTCFVDSPTEMGLIKETRFCHFKISRNRLTKLNESKNKNPKTENFSFTKVWSLTQSSLSLLANC